DPGCSAHLRRHAHQRRRARVHQRDRRRGLREARRAPRRRIRRGHRHPRSSARYAHLPCAGVAGCCRSGRRRAHRPHEDGGARMTGVRLATDWGSLTPVLWESVQEAVYMVAVTLVIGGVAGLLIGSVLYATRPGNLFANAVVFNVMNLVINVIRPIPFIIFLTAVGPVTKAIAGTTLCTEAAIVPMTIMAAVVIGRVVEQNLVAVDPGIVEAALAI